MKKKLSPIACFTLALQFLTVFRIPVEAEVDERVVSKSMAWFPVVGLLVGFLMAGVWGRLASIFPSSFLSLLVVLLLAVVTRGLHLDGLSDTLDGLGGGYTREKRLEIMKDSHVGAFGVIGIVFAILLKWVAIWKLPEQARVSVLMLFPVLSRFAMVLVAWRCPYARREGGLGQTYVDSLGGKTVLIATLCTALISIMLLSYWGVLLLIFTVLLSGAASVFFTWTLGGVTGDVLGAINEICEILVLSLCLALPLH